MTTDPDFAAMRQRCEDVGRFDYSDEHSVFCVNTLPTCLARIAEQEREIAELRDSLTYLFFNEAVFHNALRYCLVKGEDIPDNKPLLKAAELVRANIKLLPTQPTAPQPGEKGDDQ